MALSKAVTEHSIPLEWVRGVGAEDKSVKVPKRLGGGYMANLAVFHQLHCVNILWQHTYLDYYKPREKILQEGDEKVHQHLDHCADIVRQALMCHADTSTLTYDWPEDRTEEFLKENHTLPRTCRKWDKIMDWARDRELVQYSADAMQ
ncbi:hypothetical protein N0V90_004082 [Kalmusia sp. IMI 367209]|nr:hypothetical protein N0V90_004082 [Kalmusia sp. IMI 367209]